MHKCYVNTNINNEKGYDFRLSCIKKTMRRYQGGIYDIMFDNLDKKGKFLKNHKGEMNKNRKSE